MKCLIITLFILAIFLWPSAYSWWPETTADPISRKSKRYMIDSSIQSPLNNYNKYELSVPPCTKGTDDCVQSTHQTKFTSRLTKKTLLDRESIENNGTKVVYNMRVEKLKNLYPAKSPAKNKNEATSTSKFESKLLEIDLGDEITREDHQSISGSINDTQGRIIAYKVNTNQSGVTLMPLKAAVSVANSGAVPTVTLGQLARQMIFPNWIWTRFASNRKIGTFASNSNTTRGEVKEPTATATTVAPSRLPSVTFDNNFSRFMKLFTMVRFQNTPCVTTTGRNGTCYHPRECTTMGGTATKSCASGFGVCCVFQNSCGETSSRNGTYFVDNGMIFAPNTINTCTLQILKSSPDIKQMRLDFQVFSLQQPNAGNCELDRFIISGQNTNSIIPILCGENNNTHLNVETEGSSTGIQLSIMTTGAGNRSWSIRITQYESTSSSSSPTNCLQYHTGAMGSIRSFNYVSASSPQYLNNLNYAICIRKESGFCSVTFTNSGPDGTYMPFQVVNANDNGHLIIPSGQAGVGVRDCPFDYVLINGYRLCGERLNDATTNVLFVEDAPVTDLSNGPFIVTVRTNELDVGGGFYLYYRQNPCMSTSG